MNAPSYVEQEVIIDYTNWRGERARRRIRPLSISYTSNEWHRDAGWLLNALDVEKQEPRTFALANIHSWSAPSPLSTQEAG